MFHALRYQTTFPPLVTLRYPESRSRLTYVPAEDILNVRIQTLGVTEHSFEINVGGQTMNWLLYDVGGAVRASFTPMGGSSADSTFRSTSRLV